MTRCSVATWIAVVYDLIAKIRELALGGDAAAQSAVSELANLQPRVEQSDQIAIRRILQIEREIVDEANQKFGFFDGQQLLDLHRLEADRKPLRPSDVSGLRTALCPERRACPGASRACGAACPRNAPRAGQGSHCFYSQVGRIESISHRC